MLVDPNTREYEIEWQASALIAGVVPAQFTSTEDNTTYDLSGQAGPLMEILQIYKANNLPFSGTVDIRNYPGGAPADHGCGPACRGSAAHARRSRWRGRATAAVGGPTTG